jgi:tetratricopeptide (TPR) repeat protein
MHTKIVIQTVVVILSVVVAVSSTANGQLTPPHHTPEVIAQTPPEQLPSPRKLSGIGNAHIQITATREAQTWFDQGLNLLHDFWDYESARAFQQGIRVDPECAMCYWGLSKAEGFFHSNAQGYAAPALAKAVTLADHVSEREQLYIRATAADFPDASSLWRQLAGSYPDDLQAQIFLSQAVATGDESLAILERVMKADPNNSAANHYYIHALEASPHPERALHSVEVLARLAPRSGHMVHMPGHIFFRLGQYAKAERAFAASERVDERYMRDQHVAPDDDWNYVHNLMYAVANFMEEGKLQDATAASMKLSGARGEFESTLYIYSSRDSISRLDPRLPLALRTADWQLVSNLLRATTVPMELPNLQFLSGQLMTFATGMRALETGSIAAAREALDHFEQSMGHASSASSTAEAQPFAPATLNRQTGPTLQVHSDALLPPVLNTLSIMLLELRGSVLSAEGSAAAAASAFSQAATQEAELGYREPPIYIRPVYETWAAALGATRDWDGARRAYEQALIERRRSGFGLYGLALCIEKLGDTAGAKREYRQFLEAWKDADRHLPQLTHARQYLRTH